MPWWGGGRERRVMLSSPTIALPYRIRRCWQSVAWRRSLFFGMTLASVGLGVGLMVDIVDANGLTLFEVLGIPLFAILFAWISLSFWTAVAGFVVRLAGGDPAALRLALGAPQALAGRTAIVMPIYNEDPQRVFAGLDAIWRSLAAEPLSGAFDLFILSDTRLPEVATAEEAMWRALVARHHGQGRVFYRRRAKNLKRKAGNIADFVRQWGGAYDYMIVLDADSIMTGGTMVALARLMDQHAGVGIIQALPIPTGRDTLFARLVQFAARLNGPMLASGLAFWQLGEGNYWGHNAIIRVRAFADHCALPRLPGREPLGGEILSHDFVEAALMRRAGFKVWLVADLGGSWEEMPSNVIDYAARDRRWAQGNLQHKGILPFYGLHWLSRLHLTTGMLSYATSPIWLILLLVSSVVTCLSEIRGHPYFQTSYTLFPVWPETRSDEIAILLILTAAVLLLPKFLGLLLALRDTSLRVGYGGGLRLGASLLIEQLFSILLAPIMMMFHSAAVVSVLFGTPVRWDAQARGDRGIGLREAFARHKFHMALGIIWGAVVLVLAPRFIWWMVPVLAGLILSVPLTMWTSRRDVGQALRRVGLFRTPEETAPPAELRMLAEAPDFSCLPVADAGWKDGPTVPVLAPCRMEVSPISYWRFGRTAKGHGRAVGPA